MTSVYVGIGSNIDKHKHIEVAVGELSGLGDLVRQSTIYESPSLGFQGAEFFNLIVEIQTSLTLEVFTKFLRDIEIRWGRAVDAKKYQDRTLDLDIILFGDMIRDASPQLPRKDIYHYPFVIQPLYELSPELIIPGDGRTVREIWLQAENLDVLRAVRPWFSVSE
ncbi:2-amino-4-hydroxy-6-hydroxymethyldihydropteridinepyrophosphokinase [Vibrio aerogenes CECT 7868]|uniref:2-amino-4-hydroxy-6-hydroxymethyldihydropteridine diphosphokinase n=1 Tax=Vibrio aerogenes CECT 7868 TaxID=1216006 RepID=A0A1M5YEY8_9VIBR|nr:2-amino-4-hydroxy-6-hydroxymethyldihydropteridine diphosphokinase [Vibrio aerogenes]SHI10474.1 2-amino-4-hydroxy-6-hydroxymethyldihydropteridinepyrophosphokinase [Vibrio aerogenes CECT 7868]